LQRIEGPHPGNSEGCETKAFAEKAIRKIMKTKGEYRRMALTKVQLGREQGVRMWLIPLGRDLWVHPTPGVLLKEPGFA
jgi:hypothetical protein